MISSSEELVALHRTFEHEIRKSFVRIADTHLSMCIENSEPKQNVNTICTASHFEIKTEKELNGIYYSKQKFSRTLCMFVCSIFAKGKVNRRKHRAIPSKDVLRFDSYLVLNSCFVR